MPDDIHVDMDGLITSLKNEVQISLLRTMCTDDKQKEDVTKMVRAFTKRGIDVEVAMDILIELGEYFKSKEN